MSRTESLRERYRADWDAAVGHRFVDELLAGTLADDVLAHYLVQDYQFLDVGVALVAQACATAPTLPSRLVFGRQLGVLCGEEDTYFGTTFDELRVSAADREDPERTKTSRDFEAFMRSVTASRSYAACVTVCYVTEAIYLAWGQRADREPIGDLAPKHLGWIDLHRGPAFEAWVDFLTHEVDRLQLDAAAEERVDDLFGQAVALERAFFDAAYAG